MTETLGNDWETHVRNLALPLMTYLGGPRQIPLGGFLWPVALSKESGSFSFFCCHDSHRRGPLLCCNGLFVCFLCHSWVSCRQKSYFRISSELNESKAPHLQRNPGTELTFKASELLLPQPTWSFAQVSLWLISTLSASSVRLLWPLTLSIPLQVTLTSPPYHTFYLFLASAIIWQSQLITCFLFTLFSP